MTNEAIEATENGAAEPVREPGLDGVREPRQFLTTVECAAILRLSPRTLERMRVQGAGPRYVKAGRGLRSKVLYQMADILSWTEAHRFGATSEYAVR